METLVEINSAANSIVWGLPMIVSLIGVGILLTAVTRGIQFFRFPFAVRQVLGGLGSKPAGEGTVTPFQALSTSLAATVGVGNIAGVSTAIASGGPGVLFWLFVSGLVGMATKFAEIAVSLRYREKDAQGVMRGGAMYVLSRGLRLPWLGAVFAALTALAAFGIGNMTQANSVADVAKTSFGVPPYISGLVLAAAASFVVLGGIRRIAEIAELLVPGMCLLYFAAAVFVVVKNAAELPGVIHLILSSAFSGQAALGAFAGAGVRQAMQFGIARGLASNEAGLGSAPIVHASAVTDHPVRQAMYGIFGVFVDTLVVCMLTGFVLLSTGVWTSGGTGASLSAQAFQAGLPGAWGNSFVSIATILFGFSTTIGWVYYGETAITYLLGTRAARPYRLIWIGVMYLGAVGSLPLIWSLSDTMNGLMAVPNLAAVLGSLGLLRRLIAEFFPARG